MISRRQFISLLGGAAAAWPVAARGQQAERMRRIGVLMGGAETDPEQGKRIGAFRQVLRGLGWIEGRNITIDSHYTAGEAARTQTLAKELIERQPEVILAATTGRRRSPQSYAHIAHRVRRRLRSGRQRVCREPAPARRQCHRLHQY